MSNGPLPSLDRVETLGDDSPSLIERVRSAASQHRGIATGLVIVGVVILIAAAAFAFNRWRSTPAEIPPGPLASASLSVTSTGQGGVVIDRQLSASGGTVTGATVRLEVKATLTGPRSAVGRVVGIVGPGVGSTDAAGIPPVASGDSAVGLVTASVECATAPGSVDSDELTMAVTMPPATSGQRPAEAHIMAPLGSAGQEWAALVRTACSPLSPQPSRT